MRRQINFFKIGPLLMDPLECCFFLLHAVRLNSFCYISITGKLFTDVYTHESCPLLDN